MSGVKVLAGEFVRIVEEHRQWLAGLGGRRAAFTGQTLTT